jgi:hypothetical protein
MNTEKHGHTKNMKYELKYHVFLKLNLKFEVLVLQALQHLVNSRLEMKVIAKQKAFTYQDVDWVLHLEVNAYHFGRHRKHFEK